METFLNPLRSLLKYSLEENYKIDRSRSPCDLSIIQEYSFDELCEELRFVVEILLTYKKNAKSVISSKIKERQDKKIAVEMKNEEHSKILNSSLNRKLKKIQEKYLEKVQELMRSQISNETSHDFSHVLTEKPECRRIKKHCRRVSSFRLMNSRHSASDRGCETEKKLLSNIVASVNPKTSRRSSYIKPC